MDEITLRASLAEFRSQQSIYHNFAQCVKDILEKLLIRDGIRFQAIDARVKSEKSLDVKLADAERAYKHLSDITDLVGLRVIVYNDDDVDRVDKMVRREFEIDRRNSVDKREALNANQFGYLSLHDVISLDQRRSTLPENQLYHQMKAEIQIRSLLQHAWAEVEHDLGYKAEAAIPAAIKRRFARVAGLLEIADAEFRQIRHEALNLDRTIIPPVRAEGLTESLPALTLTIPRSSLPDSRDSINYDLSLHANTNITSHLFEGRECEAYLLAEGASRRGPFRATLSGVNSVVFPSAFQAVVSVNQNYKMVEIHGLRVNANRLGAYSVLTPSTIQVRMIAVPSGTAPAQVPPVILTQWSDVAQVVRSLEIGFLDSTGCPGQTTISCAGGINAKLPTTLDATNSEPTFFVRFREAFYGAFRTEDEECGADKQFASSGTVLLATLQKIPLGVYVYASATDHADSGGASALLCSTDANGSKTPNERVPQTLAGRDKRGNEIVSIKVVDGTAYVAWEWQSQRIDTHNMPREVCFGITLAVLPGQVCSHMDPITFKGSYGPLSNVGTAASNPTPLPRFAPGSMALNVLCPARWLDR